MIQYNTRLRPANWAEVLYCKPIGPPEVDLLAIRRAEVVCIVTLRRAEVLFSNPPAAGGAGVSFSVTLKTFGYSNCSVFQSINFSPTGR